jgi:hypothetical protein
MGSQKSVEPMTTKRTHQSREGSVTARGGSRANSRNAAPEYHQFIDQLHSNEQTWKRYSSILTNNTKFDSAAIKSKYLKARGTGSVPGQDSKKVDQDSKRGYKSSGKTRSKYTTNVIFHTQPSTGKPAKAARAPIPKYSSITKASKTETSQDLVKLSYKTS